MADEVEQVLLGYVERAGLPAEEPMMGWLADPDSAELKLWAGDHALLMADGLLEYHVRADGWVEVRDHRDPRSMRSQFYQPDHPGQPYMHPSMEHDHLPRR